MSHHAHLQDGVVVELIPATVVLDGHEVPLAQRYHPDFVASLVPAPPEVQPGWRLVDGAWVAPE